jgi:hypothetical protein
MTKWLEELFESPAFGAAGLVGAVYMLSDHIGIAGGGRYILAFLSVVAYWPIAQRRKNSN